MTIRTVKGKTFEHASVYVPMSDTGSVMIDYEDERKISEIAADWEGLDSFTVTIVQAPGAVHTYTGYIRLESLMRRQKIVRVVLRR